MPEKSQSQARNEISSNLVYFDWLFWVWKIFKNWKLLPFATHFPQIFMLKGAKSTSTNIFSTLYGINELNLALKAAKTVFYWKKLTL